MVSHSASVAGSGSFFAGLGDQQSGPHGSGFGVLSSGSGSTSGLLSGVSGGRGGSVPGGVSRDAEGFAIPTARPRGRISAETEQKIVDMRTQHGWGEKRIGEELKIPVSQARSVLQKRGLLRSGISAETEQKIVDMRTQHGWGENRIGKELKIPASQAHRVLQTHGLLRQPASRSQGPGGGSGNSGASGGLSGGTSGSMLVNDPQQVHVFAGRVDTIAARQQEISQQMQSIVAQHSQTSSGATSTAFEQTATPAITRGLRVQQTAQHMSQLLRQATDEQTTVQNQIAQQFEHLS